MRKPIEVAILASLTEQRLRDVGNAYKVFFWVYEVDFIRPCIVKITASHPRAALRMARAAHPHGKGFCFSESDGRIIPARPAPALEPPQLGV